MRNSNGSMSVGDSGGSADRTPYLPTDALVRKRTGKREIYAPREYTMDTEDSPTSARGLRRRKVSEQRRWTQVVSRASCALLCESSGAAEVRRGHL